PLLPTGVLVPSSVLHRRRSRPCSTAAVARYLLRLRSAIAGVRVSTSPLHSRCPLATLLPDHPSLQSSHRPATVHTSWSLSDRMRASNAVDCRCRPQMDKSLLRIGGS